MLNETFSVIFKHRVVSFHYFFYYVITRSLSFAGFFSFLNLARDDAKKIENVLNF